MTETVSAELTYETVTVFPSYLPFDILRIVPLQATLISQVTSVVSAQANFRILDKAELEYCPPNARFRFSRRLRKLRHCLERPTPVGPKAGCIATLSQRYDPSFPNLPKPRKLEIDVSGCIRSERLSCAPLLPVVLPKAPP